MNDVVQGAQAVTRALKVLKAIARTRVTGISLAKLTRDTDLNKPTVHRLVLALMAEGMVEQDPHSLLYFLGPECYALGVIASERHGLGRAAANTVARMAQRCGDSAFFSIRSDVNAVCLIREDGDYPLKTHVLLPGIRHPLGIGAGSLAILAALDDAEVERCLAANADLIGTKYPGFSIPLLRDEVIITRARGYSVNEGHVVAGSWGMGIAIHSHNGDVIGALSIAAVESRLKKERQEELAPMLIEEARVLEKQIQQAETIQPVTATRNGR